MAFDDVTRGRVQRFVGAARALLTEEFSRQLQQDYGLDPSTGNIADLDGLAHLDDRRLETARILREILAHYLAAEMATGTGARCTVLDRIVREQAFTILNRLAALRMMEARGILIESVARGYQSRGFQLYQRVANGALGETGEAYRVFLLSVFDTFAADLPALFDRRLFPREAALLAVLKEFDAPDLEPLWGEDETIGWIYQHFNSKEERQAMRKVSSAPRNSRELAVRNQFFTPRYVVEFLVDNTLGRLWFKWTGGRSSLRDRCQYLLVKPDEQPDAAERLRDPRTIKLLDPACGSMHFGLYAFDLFLVIYREAWAWEVEHGPGSLDTSTQPEAGFKPLSETYPDEATFLRDAPRLIIERNIYGVEIDPRAAQIASLALWLRAQRAWHDRGVKAADRPAIGRGNVVAAVAPPAEVDLRHELMARMDALDAELFEKSLFLLKGLPELGVLLQVERELPALIRQVYIGHGNLFRTDDEAQWNKAETRLHLALALFVQAAQSTYQGRLFAQDALEGFRLIDLTRHLFDIILMNPPFGENTLSTNSYIEELYPYSKGNILAHFIDRAESMLHANGYIGAIVSRTCFFLQSFANFREHVLEKKLSLNCFADLGVGVLDAMVETAASTWQKGSDPERLSPFIRGLKSDKKALGISTSAALYRSGCSGPDYFERRVSQFAIFSDRPYVYWINIDIAAKISSYEPIDPSVCSIRVGLQTGDDFRFLRLWWELKSERILVPRVVENKYSTQDECKHLSFTGNDWVWYSKTEEASPILSSIHLCVIWKDDGKQIKAFHVGRGDSISKYVRSESFYFLPSLSYMLRSSRLVPYLIPSGVIPTAGRSQVYPEQGQEIWLTILLSSNLATAVARFRGEEFRRPKFQNSMVSAIPYSPPTPEDVAIASIMLSDIRDKVSTVFKSDETEPFFRLPEFLMGEESAWTIDRKTIIGEEMDRRIAQLYDLTDRELDDLERDHNESISRTRLSDEEAEYDLERAGDSNDHDALFLLLSWAVGVAFGRFDWRLATGKRKAPPEPELFDPLPAKSPGMLPDGAVPFHVHPGILVDDPGNPHDLPRLIEDVVAAVDRPTPGDVRRWLQRDFFPHHLKHYSKSRRKAPIYWPLSIAPGGYTIWVYYPALTDQTLYTAANDFVSPKLEETARLAAALRTRSDRRRDEERQLEQLQDLEAELRELQDELLRLAPDWKPSHDDGVQITAAPLWRLFRYRPWQTVLRETWGKLGKGDYDWAHLALSYWPDRVRDKCRTDKSLAIAHDLEDLYEPPPETSGAGTRGRKRRVEAS